MVSSAEEEIEDECCEGEGTETDQLSLKKMWNFWSGAPPWLPWREISEDQRILAQCIELDLITEMDSAKATLKAIVEMIREYAEDYREREELFAHSPNRAHHKPYVDEVLRCNTEQELLERLVVRYGSIPLQSISPGAARTGV